ncbi:MAG: hypothetical protein ACRDK4_10240 [Solirubrobacteraceae bacterium]
MADPYWRSRPKGRSAGPPGLGESLLSGRSGGDRDAHQELMTIGMILLGSSLLLLLFGFEALFKAVGLQVGLWAVPAALPALGWLIVCGFARRTLRPAVIEEMSLGERVVAVMVLTGVFWLVWPLWAGPTSSAWHAAHAGLEHVKIAGTPSYPVAIIIDSSPLALGLVISIVFATTVLAVPNIERWQRKRDREWPGPPADPEPLRASLLSHRQHDQSGRGGQNQSGRSDQNGSGGQPGRSGWDGRWRGGCGWS